MRATRRAALVLLAAAICSCEKQQEAPAAESDSGTGTIRLGVGPECPGIWSVEIESGDRLWPVTDAALQVEGLPVRFGAQQIEGAMSTCMSGTRVRFTRLERVAEDEQSALWSTKWRLVDLDGSPAIGDAEATLEFPEEGKAAGRATCNRFFATATVAGDTIRFSAIGATRMACEEPLASQEATYLRALQHAERYAIEGDALVIYAYGMAEPLRFARVGSTSPPSP